MEKENKTPLEKQRRLANSVAESIVTLQKMGDSPYTLKKLKEYLKKLDDANENEEIIVDDFKTGLLDTNPTPAKTDGAGWFCCLCVLVF